MRVAPARLNAIIAGLFVIGSSLFAIGSVPAYIHAVGAWPDAATYAAGSVFFTTAAAGQLLQADLARRGDAGWWAAATQLPGTVFFNVSTFAALAHNLSAAQADRLVWRPDIYGSVLFLVASGFGLRAVERRFTPQPRAAAWWVGWLNMAGSTAFMASALASYVLPDTGELIDVPVSVGGTLVGALCFLLGAALLIPAWQQATAPTTSARKPSTTPVPGRTQGDR